ncbi:hypothetical protein GH714_040344 [Hevea brasiliensis]|uniref:Cell number regulator 6 n=1 Tax=Hevea brasiliensis TaxID=3981 RepID=A0A6A6MT99_HEVBR|nr:hypothetical protein GH714_040344 [Hevea brasiliensis]
MADASGHSRYVKLTKEQTAVEDIKPGKLNQPIEVPQLAVRKCNACGQPLPEDFEPPADEPSTTGIFACAEDNESCQLPIIYDAGLDYFVLVFYWGKMLKAICVEGGMALAAATATAIFHGVDPRTSFLICEGLLFAWWMCGIYTGLVRQSLQRKYHLKNSPCDPCRVHCCMHWRALCQEHREMRERLSDTFVMPMAIVNPPPAQDISSVSEHRDSEPSSEKGISLEIQAL